MTLSYFTNYFMCIVMFFGKSVILRHQPFHGLFVAYFTYALFRFRYASVSGSSATIANSAQCNQNCHFLTRRRITAPLLHPVK